MSAPVVLIVGCGDVGSRLGLRLSAQGWTVYGLRRQTAALPAPIRPVAADLEVADCPAAWPSGELDYLVYAVAAQAQDEASYRRAYVQGLQQVLDWLALHQQRPKRLLFLSSTGVYAQHAGEWVDEDSPTQPDSFNGRILLEAEQLAQHSGYPATSVRLAGLYGPGRQWLINQVRQGYQVPAEPPLYSNRIHVEDAAGLLAYLLEQDAQGRALERCYLGVDDEPVALHQVIDWLARQLGQTAMQGTLGSRRAGSKRCSNARARALGWQPEYPGYQQGYGAILAP